MKNEGEGSMRVRLKTGVSKPTLDDILPVSTTPSVA